MNCLGVPAVAPDHQGRHRLYRALDPRNVRRARAFAPADEALVRRQLDDDIRHAAAVDERTCFHPLVGNADDERLQLGDLHAMYPRGAVNNAIGWHSRMRIIPLSMARPMPIMV